MTISGRIADDLKTALKAGDKTKVSVLRMVKASIKNREIEKGSDPTDDDVKAILMSFAKRSRESIEQFSKAGRTDLAEKEENELSVVLDYLPKQLGEDEIRAIVKEIIAAEAPAGTKDMGKVMKSVMARIKGQAEGKLINTIVKEMLEVQ